MPAVLERKLAKELPGGQRCVRMFARFQADSRYLASEHSKLVAKYPDQWIAIYNGKIVGHSPRIRELEQQLRHKNISIRDAVVEFVTERPTTLIL